MSYLLSIVIPTKNRQKYAALTVKQIYNVTDSRTQIVVCDNSDECGLLELINGQVDDVDKRIDYFYTKKPIPGVDNYALGIEKSKGKYICCIGDDDGVLGYIIDFVEWADKNEIEAIRPGVQASYLWPGAVKDFPHGCVNLAKYSADFYYSNSKLERDKILESGCEGFSASSIIKAYHGIVRKDLYEQIKNSTGRYCGGLSPDIYLSFALTSFADKVLCLNVPLTIFGVCGQSTTADGMNRTNVGKLESAPHFVGQKYEWSQQVPRFYCGRTIWADSALHALYDLKCYDYNKLSIEKMSAFCLINYPEFKNEIMDNFKRNDGNVELLNNIINEKRKNETKSSVMKAIKQNRCLASIFRKMRSLYGKLFHCDNFSIMGVGDIIAAESIISKKINKKYAELLKKLCTPKSDGE